MYNKIGKVGDYMEVINNDYIKYGREIIKLINKNGAEAYFVGHFARSVVLNKPFSYIELFTTATNQNLQEIFDSYPHQVIDEETVYLNYHGYDFSLCTFKTNIQKEYRRANKRHYNTTLMDYLERRDFVINALAINYNNKIIDVFDAQKDLKKKRIRTIGVAKVRFNESPVRMLRAMALVSEYGFRLDKGVYKGIKKRRKLLKRLSSNLIAVELKPILDGKYAKKAIKLIYETGMYKKMPVFRNELKRLATRFKQESLDEFLINTFLKNGEVEQSVLRCADNEEFVKKVLNLALTNPKSDFDTFTLYRNGLDACLAANKANSLVRNAKKKYKQIEANYNSLPIKKTCDLEFKGQDVLKITKDGGGTYLIELMEEIEGMVLMGELKNDYEAIRVYVCKRLYEMKNTSNSSIHIKIEDEPIEEEQLVNSDDNKEFTEKSYEDDDRSDYDYEEQTEENEEVVANSDFYSNEVKKNDLSEQLKQIEIDELEAKLNKEIDELINNSQVLDGLIGKDAVDTYNRMKARYREALIEKNEKYKKLKEKNNE